MNKNLMELDKILSDFEDLESLAYFQMKSNLKNGITYKTNNYKYSNNQSDTILMNFIKPFFNLFHTDSILYFKSKYKKRKVMEFFRTKLETLPLCLDDIIKLEIFQEGMLVFEKTGILTDFEKPETLVFKNTCPDFKITLIEDGWSRNKLEEEMNTYFYINSLIQKYFMSLRNKTIPGRKRFAITKWFGDKLNLVDFDLMDLTVNDLKKISSNVFEIEQLLNTLILSETIILTKTKRQEEYRETLLKNSNKNSFLFNNQIIIHGC